MHPRHTSKVQLMEPSHTTRDAASDGSVELAKATHGRVCFKKRSRPSDAARRMRKGRAERSPTSKLDRHTSHISR
jgi:hypothetical protein